MAAPAQAAANPRCVHPQVAPRGLCWLHPTVGHRDPPQATGSNKDVGEEVPSRAPGTASGSVCSQETWHNVWFSVRSFWEWGGRGGPRDAQRSAQVPPELSLVGSITFKVLPGCCSTQSPLLLGGSSLPHQTPAATRFFLLLLSLALFQGVPRCHQPLKYTLSPSSCLSPLPEAGARPQWKCPQAHSGMGTVAVGMAGSWHGGDSHLPAILWGCDWGHISFSH